MTEAEWLASEDPQAMLDFVADPSPSAPRPVSERKLRLFAVACAERMKAFGVAIVPAALEESYYPDAASSAESWADLMTWGANYPVAEKANLLRDIIGNPFRPVTLPRVAYGSVMPDTGRVKIRSFGCPWLTPQVLSLATAAFEDRPGRKCYACIAGGRVISGGSSGYTQDACPYCNGTGTTQTGELDTLTLLALADALEEAGCDNEDILRHLRGWERYCPEQSPHAWIERNNPHVRGCWALDLILSDDKVTG